MSFHNFESGFVFWLGKIFPAIRFSDVLHRTWGSSGVSDGGALLTPFLLITRLSHRKRIVLVDNSGFLVTGIQEIRIKGGSLFRIRQSA